MLLVKLIDCLNIVAEEEEKYLKILKKYSDKMVNKGINVKYVLNKVAQKTENGVLVKYSGLKIVFESEDRRFAEKILLPPKFAFDGLEYIVSDGEAYCEYSVFRKFFRKINCKYELMLNIKSSSFIRKLCSEAAKYVSNVYERIGYSPQWVPLVSSGILAKISKELRLKISDIKDYIVYLYDNNEIDIRFGEANELWLNYGGVCHGK